MELSQIPRALHNEAMKTVISNSFDYSDFWILALIYNTLYYIDYIILYYIDYISTSVSFSYNFTSIIPNNYFI